MGSDGRVSKLSWSYRGSELEARRRLSRQPGSAHAGRVVSPTTQDHPPTLRLGQVLERVPVYRLVGFSRCSTARQAPCVACSAWRASCSASAPENARRIATLRWAFSSASPSTRHDMTPPLTPHCPNGPNACTPMAFRRWCDPECPVCSSATTAVSSQSDVESVCRHRTRALQPAPIQALS